MSNSFQPETFEGISEEAGRIMVAWEALSKENRQHLSLDEFIQKRAEGRLTAEQQKAIAEHIRFMDTIWDAASPVRRNIKNATETPIQGGKREGG